MSCGACQIYEGPPEYCGRSLDSCDSCESYCESACQRSCQSGCETSCQTSCQISCQTGAQTNVPPTVPSSISVPASIQATANITVTWGAATDSNLSGYQLERSVDNSTYSQVYRGANRSFSEKITAGWQTVRYRVRAYDAYGANSGYRTSSIVTVINNFPPTINIDDGDLGGKKGPFKFDFEVDDLDLSQKLDITITLNGRLKDTIINASRNHPYTVNITQEDFDALKINEQNLILIEVKDNAGATVNRRKTFTRINSNPTIKVTNANLGEQNNPFEIGFIADDPENDRITAKIFLGSKQLADLGEITKKEEVKYSIDLMDYVVIKNGQHQLRIEITDEHGLKAYGYIEFIKNVTSAWARIYKEETAMPERIAVLVLASLAQGAVLTVKVCNNAKDTNPTWETLDDTSIAHTFSNKNKEADKPWAVGVWTEIDKGTSKNESYFFGFSGAYE